MEEENTVELIDLLRVLWKWKWFVVIITLAFSVVAGIISYKMPRIYEVSMVIEPGVVDIDPNGQFIYLDKPSNIQSKIAAQAYNSIVLEKLQIDRTQLYFKFKTNQPRNSNTIKIWLETDDIDKGNDLLSGLYQELIQDYQRHVDTRKLKIDKKITMSKRQVNVNTDEIKALEKEIATIKANTDKIMEERSEVISKSSDKLDKLSLLIYTNTIQQNMAYHNKLQGQFAALKGDIERLKTEIDTLQIKMQSVENIRLIQSPQSSIYPIAPRKRVHVMLGFAVGLFLSVFLAFFIEYLRKKRAYPTSSPIPDQTSSVTSQGR
jgi:uncharacterized protein involved in exopolysaccharide biosynthesis